ncbi:hypothetical protein [Labrys wisconsinensis]|uniref:Uncharacterized protein n=1 Tax=Labrys wisconsinensis TaxID=425677 RepID=A0ABU0IZR0_9HYPH|nr:hypothetical protein [Labrys wisconsinensis]MDQ0467494.1 hypothetical protein [Labrys wisconsinensis]
MFRKLISASLVAATLAGATLATTGTAEAGWGRGGAFAAGAIGGLLLGGIAANSYYNSYRPAYYYAPACFWRSQRVYDAYYGYHWVRVRICR